MAAALGDYGRWHSILEPKPEDVEEFQNFPGEGKIEVKYIYIYIYIGNRKIAHRASRTGKKPLYPSKNKHYDSHFKQA